MIDCDYTVSGGVVTATPRQPLPYGALIKCLITPALRGKHNERLDKDYNWQFRTVPDELRVSKTYPENNAQNVSPDADITITFSHNLDEQTVNDKNILVDSDQLNERGVKK